MPTAEDRKRALEIEMGTFINSLPLRSPAHQRLAPSIPQPAPSSAARSKLRSEPSFDSQTKGPSRIEHALELASRGVRVFPLLSNTRDPIPGLRWGPLRTCNPQKIKAQLKSSSTYAAATGDGIVVIDVDHKNGTKPGLTTFKEWDILEGWPRTFTARTCTGGKHLYYRAPPEMRIKSDNKGRCFGPGIDVKGHNGYVVGPGSAIDGRTYVIEDDAPFADLPAWALAKCEEEFERPKNAAEPLCEWDLGANIERAKYYLLHEAPPAIEGNHGDDTTVGTARNVRDWAVSETMCLELMLDHYNERCSPPWDPDDMAIKVANAYRYGKKRPGNRQAGVLEFDTVEIVDKRTTPPAEPMTAGGTAADWPEPANLWADESEPPDLAPGLVPALIERYARYQGRLKGVEPGAVAAATVTTLASLIPASNVVQVQQKSSKWVEHAIFWTMLLGDPGGKKSPVMGAAKEPVAHLESQWQKHFKTSLARHSANAADRKVMAGKGAKAAEAPKPKLRRKIVKDATTEAITSLLADNQDGLLAYHDELSALFGGMDAYRPRGGKDRPFWLEAKDGGRYPVDRKGADTIVVPCAAVSIVGGIQPERVQSLAPGLAPDGLLQRFWPVYVKELHSGEDEDDDKALDAAMLNLACDLADVSKGRRYKFAPEAAAEMRHVEALKHEEQVRAEHHAEFIQFLNKMPASYVRLALAFHFFEWFSDETNADMLEPPPDLISQDTACRARRFMTEFVLGHARVFYRRCVERGASESHARWIAGHILSRSIETISDRDIDRACPALRRLERRQQRLAAMHELEAESWAKPGRSGRDGKPVQWKINPAVHDGRFREIALCENTRRIGVREKIAEDGARRRAEKQEQELTQ